jgi:hypothetical protein
MKRILKMAALAFIIVLGSSSLNKTSAQYSNNDVSYQTFYDELSPYGRWIDYPGQGYVWVPDADQDFQPYSTNGHWVWTEDYEWMWVSDYEWGWAPFHYGRWDNDPSYGWYWVPGYEWSPAWVAWRDGGDYYGWAPLRPGINISINFNIGSYSPPYNFWSFAPRRYISSPRIYDYCVDRRQNLTIINYTTIINYNNYSSNYGFRSGPRRYDVERYTGRINPVRFRDSYRPGRTEFRNNEVSVYRPNVRHDDNRNFAPSRFDRYDRQNNGIARNDNGFRRNDNNNAGRDNNINNRDNNLPVRRERDNNSTVERRNDDRVRQPQNQNNSNNNVEQRRNVFDRNDNNTRQPNRDDQRRTYGQRERVNTNPNQNNNPAQNNNNDTRRFERRSDNNTNIPPREQRQDTRNDNNNRQQRQYSPQTEQRQRPQQEQPRQFERRDNGNGQQNNNGSNGNNGFRKDRKRD